MWIFTTAGFISVSAHPADRDVLVIRARDRASIDTVADGVELVGGSEAVHVETLPLAFPTVAYPFQVYVDRAAFGTWLAHETAEYVDYEDFERAAEGSLGPDWADVLRRVRINASAIEDIE